MRFILLLGSQAHCCPVITKDQQKILNQIKTFVTKHQAKPTPKERCTFVNSFSARDRRFIQELADSLHLHTTWDEVDDYGQNLVVLTFDMEGVSEDGTDAEAVKENGEDDEEEDESEWSSEEDSEGDVAIQRVFQKYDKAKVVENVVEDFEDSYEEKMKEKMAEWKRQYYKVSPRLIRSTPLTDPKEKLEIDFNKPEEMHEILFCYIEGLQWVLNYYYKGVSSWGWFYKYHFSPKITGQPLQSHQSEAS